MAKQPYWVVELFSQRHPWAVVHRDYPKQSDGEICRTRTRHAAIRIARLLNALEVRRRKSKNTATEARRETR